MFCHNKTRLKCFELKTIVFLLFQLFKFIMTILSNEHMSMSEKNNLKRDRFKN